MPLSPFPSRDMIREAFHNAMLAAGVPEPFATILPDVGSGIASASLFDDGGSLSELLGRATTPFERTIGDFLSSSGPAVVQG
ncbi:hypothetical protein NFI95_03905 [Acetobacteraceae bacterium KSS8]|uniref:Uncharacterized protein n=1 Tax=Endosaccharibacter trunci TaxID=2812733 RepID=A0ABT1W6Y8_9PROT|nr:hypothetical protein [Acetobacteraceae bacterium KSS8]